MKYLILLLLLIGCSKDFSKPDEMVTHYFSEITSKKVSRDFFSKYTTGNLEESILGMSDDEFELFTTSNLAQRVSINITNENCLGNICNLTVILKYSTTNQDNERVDSEIKKIVELERVEEYWKVSKMSNIRTFHEGKSPIHVESK